MSKNKNKQVRTSDNPSGLPLPDLNNPPLPPSKYTTNLELDKLLDAYAKQPDAPYTGNKWLVTSQSNTTSEPYTTQLIHQDIEQWVIDNPKRHVLFCTKISD